MRLCFALGPITVQMFQPKSAINACDTAKCEVYVCPSVLHTAYCCDKFTNGALVTPQYMNFKGCGAFTSEMALVRMKCILFLAFTIAEEGTSGALRLARWPVAERQDNR